MHCIFVGLFCIICVGGINGASLLQPPSIDDDAIGLAQSTEKCWSLKPAILKRTRPLVYCQIIDQCCDDDDRSEAISLTNQYINGTGGYRFVEVMLTCMNPTTSNKVGQLCSSTIESIISSRITFQNPDVIKYIKIIRNYKKELNGIYDHLLFTCNSEEIHALFCLSNTKLVETCARKILQKIYDNDNENYQVIVVYINNH